MGAKPRFDTTNLVSHAEIADRLKVAVDTVHKWKRRYDDFPDPLRTLRIGPVYWWPDVEQWYGERAPDASGTGPTNPVAQESTIP